MFDRPFKKTKKKFGQSQNRSFHNILIGLTLGFFKLFVWYNLGFPMGLGKRLLLLLLSENGCLDIIHFLGFSCFNGFMELLNIYIYIYIYSFKSKWMFVSYAIVCESCIHILSIYRALCVLGGLGGVYGIAIDKNIYLNIC
jgi:hypothetical protein